LLTVISSATSRRDLSLETSYDRASWTEFIATHSDHVRLPESQRVRSSTPSATPSTRSAAHDVPLFDVAGAGETEDVISRAA